jgi:hypothetical protein
MGKSIKLENGMKVEEDKVWTTMVEFKDLLGHSGDDNRFVSVTDWINGEGFDIEVDGKPMLSLTSTEAEALMHALKTTLERDTDEQRS